MLMGVVVVLLGSEVRQAKEAPPVAPRRLTEATVPRISLNEFKRALANKTIRVLDVRDATQYAEGHIPGAVSVPLTSLEERVEELKKSKRPIVTYCA